MIEIFSKRLLFANSEEEILKKGEVVFENATAGIYSVNIPIDGLYEVIVVGGGGGCGQMALGGTQYTIAVSASGGSGAVVRGIFKISAGKICNNIKCWYISFYKWRSIKCRFALFRWRWWSWKSWLGESCRSTRWCGWSCQFLR